MVHCISSPSCLSLGYLLDLHENSFTGKEKSDAMHYEETARLFNDLIWNPACSQNNTRES